MYRAFILLASTQSTVFQHWSELSSHPLQIMDMEDWNEAKGHKRNKVTVPKLQSYEQSVTCNKYLK